MRTLSLFIICAGTAMTMRAGDPPEIFASAGAAKPYLDEPFKFAAGAGARFPFFDRLALRPEFLVANDRRFSHRFLLGSVTYDINDPRHAAVFYLIGGGGWVSVRDKAIPYSWGDGEFVGGAGFRFALGDRVTISTELRAGKSALPLATAQIGFRLGKRR